MLVGDFAVGSNAMRITDHWIEDCRELIIILRVHGIGAHLAIGILDAGGNDSRQALACMLIKREEILGIKMPSHQVSRVGLFDGFDFLNEVLVRHVGVAFVLAIEEVDSTWHRWAVPGGP
jgi:hypothetical protein